MRRAMPPKHLPILTFNFKIYINAYTRAHETERVCTRFQHPLCHSPCARERERERERKRTRGNVL